MPLSSDDIKRFAESYTKAWCSGSSANVGSCYSEDATSIINNGEPTIGREAITETMEAFFIDFPNLSVQMDELRTGTNQAIYLWTLEGTHSETGKFARIRGWQNWVLSEELMIIGADGGFDESEYKRQIQEGI